VENEESLSDDIVLESPPELVEVNSDGVDDEGPELVAEVETDDGDEDTGLELLGVDVEIESEVGDEKLDDDEVGGVVEGLSELVELTVVITVGGTTVLEMPDDTLPLEELTSPIALDMADWRGVLMS